ncbi:MAG: polysaccharide pyruvyl transferase CsaB [Bacillota bacterium]
MKRIVISGFYGGRNTGDEAILAAMLDALRQAIPGVDITVLSLKPEETARNFNVRSIYRGWRRQLREKIRLIKKADLLISGGGGLLQDTYPTGIISGPLPYYLLVAALAKILGTKVMFYAQGVGPINTGYGRWLTRLIANRVNFITVRDELSLTVLREVGVTRPPARLTADPVLAFRPAPRERIGEILRIEGISAEKPLLGISVRPWFDHQDYKRGVAGAADYMIEKFGCQVVFIPMEHLHDYHLAQEVQEMMEYGHQALVVGHDYLPEEYMGLIGEMDMVLGMRLHSLIFAANMGVPMVGLVYDPKVQAFIERLGLGRCSCMVEEAGKERLAHLLEEIWMQKEIFSDELAQPVSLLRQLALENATLAAGLINVPHDCHNPV